MKVLPLSPLRFHILLALANDPAPAYLIASRVSYDTFGELAPSPATLHDNLQALAARSWLTAMSERRFALTEEGYRRLESDLYRWQIVTSRAIDRLRARGSSVFEAAL